MAYDERSRSSGVNWVAALIVLVLVVIIAGAYAYAEHLGPFQ